MNLLQIILSELAIYKPFTSDKKRILWGFRAGLLTYKQYQEFLTQLENFNEL